MSFSTNNQVSRFPVMYAWRRLIQRDVASIVGAVISTVVFVNSTQRANAQEHGERANPGLTKLFADHWQWVLENDPSFASYLGDRRYNDRWPDVSLAATKKSLAKITEFAARADAIDEKSLDEKDRLNLKLFKRELKLTLADAEFHWDLLPVQQREGIQTTFELADALPFKTEKDYRDWLSRLDKLPTMVDQTIERMRAGVSSKMVHPKVILDRVAGQLAKLTAEGDPTKSPFYKPFLSVDPSLPEGVRSELIVEAKRAITSSVAPAMEKFKKFFNDEYLPAGYDRVGCWQLPKGKEMYAFRATRFTTTNLTPEEIHKIGLAEVARIKTEMMKIQKQVGFEGSFPAFLESLRNDPKHKFKTGEEMMEAYGALCKRIDPALVKVFRTIPRMPYGVEAVPMQTAPDTTAAYYREPAADGSRAGSYFINLYRPDERPKYEMEALSLHEAVPGHHFQIALAMEQGTLPEFRRFGNSTAYIEGWALYAESLGDELGFYKDPYSKFGRYTYEMWRAVRLVVDTGMHHFGWTRQQAIDFFKENAAKSELDIVNEVDRYIAWPGQALAYKIGELKIQELRRTATAELGPKFDLKEFHDVVLLEGAIPLDVLEDKVKAWIKASKSVSKGH